MKKIAVLCNHPLGLPSIDYLMEKDVLAGIACPSIPSDNFFRMQMLCEDRKIPFGIIDEQNIGRTLNDWLKQTKAEAVFVLTFPYKIPKDALRTPRFGFFNFHTGILPGYRGGDPAFWQIFAQEKFGGITVHQMTEEIDAGPIVHIAQTEILIDDTYGQHMQKLALTAREACQSVVENFSSLEFQEQDPSQVGSQKRPTFFDLLIDWEKYSASYLKALVRASNPTYGGAITFFRGVPVHLLQLSVGSSQNPPNVKAGTILSADKGGIIVASSDKKLVRLDVVYTEDGFFTGGKLATTFNIKPNEEFTLPEMPEGFGAS